MTDPKTDRVEPSAPSVTRWLTPVRLSAAALAVSAAALAVAVTPALGGGDFGQRVRAYLLANPQVLDEVVAARQGAEDQARTQAIDAAASAQPALLAADARDPAFGPADARVTVFQFFDYRCPGCKAVAPEFLATMQAHPDVRFVFKEWPILDRGEDTTSQYAARAALAAHRQGRFLAVHEALMRERALDEAAIDAILSANGVDLARARADMTTPDMSRHVADIHTAAATLGLQGTPTFFVNGRAQASIEPAALARAIEAAKRG